MTSMVADKIARLLSEYERKSDKSKLYIAAHMDVSLSNYNTYYSGTGNPTAKTLSKLIAVIREEDREMWVRFILKELLTSYPNIFWQSVQALMEEEGKNKRAEKIVISGGSGGDR